MTDNSHYNQITWVNVRAHYTQAANVPSTVYRHNVLRVTTLDRLVRWRREVVQLRVLLAFPDFEGELVAQLRTTVPPLHHGFDLERHEQEHAVKPPVAIRKRSPSSQRTGPPSCNAAARTHLVGVDDDAAAGGHGLLRLLDVGEVDAAAAVVNEDGAVADGERVQRRRTCSNTT